MDNNSSHNKYSEVKEYYGKELEKTADLKTNACCTGEHIPDKIKQYLKEIHPEVTSKYYGCGLIMPQLLEGMRILDLGSGSGQDCYLLSRMAGENGYVVGVDMTDEQLEVANRHIQYHTRKYGYKEANVEFMKAYIEKLSDLGFKENSFDIVVSNCVINLSPDKEAVLNEVYRILKPGGEMYFSDVYSDRRIPALLRDDPVLYGECLSGALYTQDFMRVARSCGFMDPRIMKSEKITVENKDLEEKISGINFRSVTYRLFKNDALEDTNEDYGQSVIYNGTIPDSQNNFELDNLNKFSKGVEQKVSGNTFTILKESRFSDHFRFKGDTSTHYGLFNPCESDNKAEEAASASCCC